MNLCGLHHIAILCHDREASLRFYSALGFVVQEDYLRPERGDEILLLKDEECGVTLELFVADGHPLRLSYPEAYGARHLAFACSDCSVARKELLQLGFDPEPLRKDTYTGKTMFFVSDPDGLPIELHE